jgi:hypothetical protein
MSQPHSEQIGELAAALAAAQGEFPDIPKDCTAKVTTRTGGSYEFKYADLETIFRTVRPVLAKHGLAISVSVEAREIELPPEQNRPAKTLGMAATATLLHTSGQWLRSAPLCVPVDPDALRRQYAQACGSAATYASRYVIEALLAIRATEDDDGNGASGNTADIDKLPPPKPKPAPPPKPPAPTVPTLHKPLADLLVEFAWPKEHKREFADTLFKPYEVTLAKLVTDETKAEAVRQGIEAEVKALMQADSLLTDRADALQVLFSRRMEGGA